ncbi:HNH endonuclease [Pectobacterium polaris]|uniref:HNH endonuclease n=1 Tax=Pectobacterium polaris TaxID=2042057 RepID=A0AAW4NXS4_9GAMM|nr:HNH endonuclease [Pectobacterium polaris]MBW5891960.1 HNH endonuclease [Pectobacterium polaris]MCA6940039.1 HNH endonuclease [Pectobacterium polaris]MCA6958684.1 HNH endonuclease [Pectobacterium polaris]UAY91692.1 HNH endonuclease [Pectobacterium polaris]
MRAISYSQEHLDIIKEKMLEANFCGGSWSDQNLEEVKAAIKNFYIREQNNTCVYCKQLIRSNNGRLWDIEHIIPRDSSIYFMFEPLNLCVTCPDCNVRKGASKVTGSKAKKKLPKKSINYMIIHPHFDTYDEHIEIIELGEFYQAKSKKGERTMYCCGLNRFYEYAGYDKSVSSDNLILKLANKLADVENEDDKDKLLREIAAHALRQLISR